jgi:hypothetical protein
MIHEVLRAFKAEGRDLLPGEYVETSHWRNEQALINQRKIGVPKVSQNKYDSLKPVNVPSEETTQSLAENKVEVSAPESSTPAAISKGGVEKSIGRSGTPQGKVVPKRIPPRKS